MQLVKGLNEKCTATARDVSVSLNNFGTFLAQRGQPGDAEQALAHYTRGLEISESLLQANPDSAQAARDVVVSHFKLAGLLAKDEEVATRHWRAYYDVLHPRVDSGMTFDPSIMRIYEDLRRRFE